MGLCKPCFSLAGGNHTRGQAVPSQVPVPGNIKGHQWGDAELGCRQRAGSHITPHCSKPLANGHMGLPIPTTTSCKLEPTSILHAAAARPQSRLPTASSSWLMPPKAPSSSPKPLCGRMRCLPITNHLRATCRETLQLGGSPTPHLLSSTNI